MDGTEKKNILGHVTQTWEDQYGKHSLTDGY